MGGAAPQSGGAVVPPARGDDEARARAARWAVGEGGLPQQLPARVGDGRRPGHVGKEREREREPGRVRREKGK